MFLISKSVLFLLIQVSELFTDPSLGDNLNIVLVGLIVLEGDEVDIFNYRF